MLRKQFETELQAKIIFLSTATRSSYSDHQMPTGYLRLPFLLKLHDNFVFTYSIRISHFI